MVDDFGAMGTTLEWFGCATFRMRVAGMTVMLDAYLDRAANAAGPRVTPDDIGACDWIVIGHAHFDHLYGAERIMANTNAGLIGNYESIRLLTEAGVPEDRMICVAGGETVDLGNGVTVSVFPSQHSCVWSHAEMSQPSAECLGDLGVTWQERQERMRQLMEYLSTELDPVAVEHLMASIGLHSQRGDGGALLYRFESPEGSVLYQDTSGHWSGIIDSIDADVAILAAAGRGNIDGEPIQGSLVDFLVRQARAIAPRLVVLCHHDDWLPGFSVATDLAPIREAFGQLDAELLELGYVTPTTILPSA